ncbi:MAG: PilC/PilY family type IV pilus protein, partial [Gammaproteobacteria bacterium]|nr:PilC/PilY family type IV pilus protein [Gammaproteobacteria bacterium]
DEINALIGGTCDANNGDNCLDDLAAWMNNNDVLPGDTGAATGSQTVQTHTIGFGLDSTLLRETAQRGGGKYYSANNASALQDAFKDILREVTADSGSFTSPAVSVNAFSRLMHRNDLYFALFKPSTKSHWDGNLKKYKLKMLTGRLAIVDANDLAAINPIDSSFKADSRSFWTEPGTTDGDDVARGGAASQLALTLSDGVTPRPLTALGSGADLAIDDTVTEGNSVSITTSLLDIVTEANADPTYHSTLLKWIKGEDVLDRDDDLDKTEPRRQLGDPLHSQPVVITYGGTDDDPDSTVYMSTNDGFLHGFDTETGAEQVAFIPADLLDIQKLAFDDTKSTGKLYGLDGGITPWVHDANGNGVIESGDHAILIVGMRRGGRNYYAIDVTDRGNPKLKWQITGGSGDFSRLGTTWSQPVLGDINVGGTKKTVLFFGGGFDQGGPDGLSEDDATPPSTHDIGNAIYIVDAETGDVIYWTSNINLTASNYEKLTGGDKMKYAIPAELAVIDSNNDGLKDQVFIGDLGGQLWRFDITNGQVGKDLVDGGVIASLGRTDPSATAADDRRFFNKPDVALINDPNYGSFLAINIGSGRRNEPTDKDIQDRFFSIWDFNVYSKPSSYSAIVSSQLHDATDNLVGQGTSAEKTAARLELDNRKGWFIDLETGTLGEKNLSSAITVDSQVLFTTYVPPGSTDPDSCEAGIGSGRFYAVKAGTGEPVNHFEILESDEDAVPTKADRSTLLGRSGIPPAPILLFPEATGGEAVPVVGNELMNLPIRQRTRKTYWYTVED